MSTTATYEEQIANLKDMNPDILVLKTNVGNKQIPNVAWLTGYVDNKISGGGGTLDSYLTKAEALTTYAAISNVYSKTDADSKFMLKTDTPNMDGYLPLTAGSSKILTGSLYTSAATPYLIGTTGKVGIRANKVDGSTYASQVALSYTNAELSDPYFINMVANASSEKQTSLRLGVQDDGTYGLTYKFGSDVYDIYHTGNLNTSNFATTSQLNSIVELAEGKTKTYIIKSKEEGITIAPDSVVSQPTNTTIIAVTEVCDAQGNIIELSKFKLGDIILVINANEPDYWVGKVAEGYIFLVELETRKIDIEDFQPLDADLTAIAGLTGISGILRKTAENTWGLDTNSYVLSEAGNSEIKNTENGITLSAPDNQAVILDSNGVEIWADDTVYLTITSNGVFTTDLRGNNEYRIVDYSMTLTTDEIDDICTW